jgi:hypothetical protein
LQLRKAFTVVSITDILIQVVATEKNRRKMYDYPERPEIAEEYNTCKRFWDLHREIQTASINGYRGRIFVGNFVTYQLGDQIFYGKRLVIFKENGLMKTEIQKMLKYDHFSNEFQDLVTTTFGQQIPTACYFLRWADV